MSNINARLRATYSPKPSDEYRSPSRSSGALGSAASSSLPRFVACVAMQNAKKRNLLRTGCQCAREGASRAADAHDRAHEFGDGGDDLVLDHEAALERVVEGGVVVLRLLVLGDAQEAGQLLLDVLRGTRARVGTVGHRRAALHGRLRAAVGCVGTTGGARHSVASCPVGVRRLCAVRGVVDSHVYVSDMLRRRVVLARSEDRR